MSNMTTGQGGAAAQGTGAAKKRLPNIPADQMKIFDDLTKPDWAEVYRDLYFETKGQNAPVNWAEDARTRRNKLYPQASHKKGGTATAGTGSKRISFKLYTALTAVSAHAGGMPLAIFEKYPDELRNAMLQRQFVEIRGEEGSKKASLSVAGNDALDAYEKNTISESTQANNAVGGETTVPTQTTGQVEQSSPGGGTLSQIE